MDKVAIPETTRVCAIEIDTSVLTQSHEPPSKVEALCGMGFLRLRVQGF